MSQKNDLFYNNNAFKWLEDIEEVDNVYECVETDVLIIGAGHAGVAAARSAIETNSKLKVMVIDGQEEEKFRVLGKGEIGHINSKWQETHGVQKVDVNEFVNDWQIRSLNRSNYKLIKTYASKSGDTFDWITNVLDLGEMNSIYPILKKPSEHMPENLNGFKSYTGSAKLSVEVQSSMMKKNRDLIVSLGGVIKYGTKAYKILKSNGTVTGAIVQDGNGFVHIKTSKGVIIAAGDYSKNKQMCRDLLTEASDSINQESYWLGQGWNGDGLRLGMLAGGRMEPRPHPSLGGNFSYPGVEVIGGTPVLRVNKYGERYSNEGFGTHSLAAIVGVKQANGILYGIFDSRITKQVEYQTNSHAAFDYTNKDKMEKLEIDLKRADEAKGEGVAISMYVGRENTKMPRRLYSGKTIEELASYIYVDKKDQNKFIETVKRYNHLCKKGQDDDYGKDKSQLHGIEKGPFYAVGQIKDSNHPIGQSLKLLVTFGGLSIDDNQQVLDDDYEPIVGLYASGNSSGTRFGFQYTTSISGLSISIAHTLGRELGRYIAETK